MAPTLVPLVLAVCVVPMSRVIAANIDRMQAEAVPPSLWRIFWPRNSNQGGGDGAHDNYRSSVY